MKMDNAIEMSSAQAWHAWLEEHHANEKEAWLVFHKIKTGVACIAYEDAVDEALCFGWIDSIIQKIDEERYARKFTPRSNRLKWSVTNKRRVARLLREGRMTAAGLAKIADLSDFREDLVETRPKTLEIPPQVEQILRSSPTAWQNFEKLPASQRRRYIGWVTDAKRAETVERRAREVLECLEQNVPLGMK